MPIDIDRLLRNPESFAGSRQTSRQAMRFIASHLHALSDLAEARELFKRALEFAASSGDECNQAHAFRLNAARLRLAGRYDEAAAALDQSAEFGRCPCCATDLQWKRGFLALTLGDQGTAIIECGKAIESYLTSSAKAVQDGHFILAEILLAASGAPWNVTGQAFCGQGDVPKSIAALRIADVVTRAGVGVVPEERLVALLGRDLPEPGRQAFKLRNYRWWDRVAVPCPSLPTSAIRDNYNEAAFGNYLIALEMSEDPADRAAALTHTLNLLRRKGMPPHRKALMHWLAACLKADRWHTEPSSIKRSHLASSGDSNMRKARDFLLKDLKPTRLPDLVAFICDAARLPWHAKNPSKALNDIVTSLGERRDMVEASLREADPQLYAAWMDAVESQGVSVVSAVEQLRKSSGCSWPMLLSNAA